MHQRHQHQQFDWCEGVSAQAKVYCWRGDASVHSKEMQSRRIDGEGHGKEVQEPNAKAE